MAQGGAGGAPGNPFGRPGQSGTTGNNDYSSTYGGAGGSSPFGQGGPQPPLNDPTGKNGTGPGAGGSGASAPDRTGPLSWGGGAGIDGFVTVKIGEDLPFIYSPKIEGTDTRSFSLPERLIQAGWDGVSSVQVDITLANNAVLGSYNTSTFALDTGNGYATGSTISLVLNANSYISGAGGVGGTSTAGFNGGPAINVRWPITIDNKGTIQGGGGGGGYGGNGYGGGGAGSEPGYQGIAPNTSAEQVLSGNVKIVFASLTNGTDSNSPGEGGKGGDAGQNGENGQAISDTSFGGSGGSSIVGIGNVTFITLGTIRGPVV